MAQAKTPVFGTNINAVPIVKDVHKESVLAATNNIVNTANAVDAVADYNTGDTEPANMLDKISDKATDAAEGSFDSLSFDDQRARLEDAFKNGSNVRDLPGVVKANLINSTREGANAGGLVTLYDEGKDEYTEIKDMDSLSASKVLDVVNRIAGNDQIMTALDIGAQAGMVRGLATTLMKWRVPEMVDKLIQKVKDEKLKASLYEEQAIAGAQAGDLTTSQYFVSKMGATRAFAIWPTLAKAILLNYRSYNDGSVTKLDEADSIVAFLDSLHDGWMSSLDDSTLASMEYVNYANETVVSIMSHHSYYKYFSFAGKVQQQSPAESISAVFPQLNGWTTYNA